MSAPWPRGDAGFTLAEVMAALGVFAIAAVGLMHVAAENTRAVTALRERAFASMVADNRLAEAFVRSEAPAGGIDAGETLMAGREWAWTERRVRLSSQGMLRIEVEVRAEPDGPVLATRVGLRSLE